MSSKLIPANPSDVLVVRDITPNITTLSVPFLRHGVIYFGGRGTVVRLSGGGVLLFSPVALTPEAVAVVERLGGGHGVKYIVAGDIEHHIFISEWVKAYPEARIIAPAGLPEKRAATKGSDPKISVDDKFFAVLADGQSMHKSISIAPDFDADFSVVYNDVHPNKEIILLYKPDRVLIEADLMMNLPATEQYSRTDAETRHNVEHPNVINRIFYRLMTTTGSPLAGQRFNWYAVSSRNRPRFNEAIQLIDKWEFDILIPCHGDTIMENGKEAFRKLFAWHLEQ
ncbi:hypothetical protein CMQ_5686 [Grosmannia clavigera kw1407]|uniref:Beta-lactamase-like protein n=1 Tax=Grosmannia clavigera (strain kw1407 / UAMH 11150) TaxID=655863 RepID=F0XTA8_GROCL|nr:uncharacterized protein CMQ_5686 [Grosmannia clavigera kw1407]EFW99265.1 hypothetical protein CMQ_5686 [Grosmannia clavigera kw1407]